MIRADTGFSENSGKTPGSLCGRDPLQKILSKKEEVDKNGRYSGSL